jgi:hypothetical protein
MVRTALNCLQEGGKSLADGAAPAMAAAGGWHTLRLEFAGATVRAFLDDKVCATLRVSISLDAEATETP